MMELTWLTKVGGPLTKRISLTPDGCLHSDGSACFMANGAARRVRFDDLTAFAAFIARLPLNDAIALGVLRDDLPEQVEIATKRALAGLDWPGIIARTADNLVYRPREPTLTLIDVDTKGMPEQIKVEIEQLGGYWEALVSVVPELANAGRVVRRSTSAGLYRTDTGEWCSGSDGRHIYLPVAEGTDCKRFLQALHERCWLHGLGWLVVSSSGQLLDRSLVDRSVFSPERLVFEGTPVLVPPLAQDAAIREPEVTEGAVLDTRAICPDLSPVEMAELRRLKDAEAHRLSGAVEKIRCQHIEEFARDRKCTVEKARHVIERLHRGVLLPTVVLPFDDPELKGTTVADVLANPERFIGESLADPAEGVAYGRCKAKVMQRADGSLWIHSFAHGRSFYDLKHDPHSIETALFTGDTADSVNKLVRLLLMADVAADEEQRLCQLVCEQAKVKISPLKARIKAAREQQKQDQANAERQRRAAERTDPRPQLPAPPANAPWLPVMQDLNEILGNVADAEPPMRNLEGVITQVRVRRLPNMHALTSSDANSDETDGPQMPAPEQPLLTQLDELMVAELIETYVDFVDVKTGSSVHLGPLFVRHYVQRYDDALPVVAAVSTLPLVLADGSLLVGPGLDRERGIVFRVPSELLAILPTREQCDDAAVREAFKFLIDDWLVDVATDRTGKCILIVAALTLIERSLLPDRPVYFITAGRRGGGKTTTLMMLLMAITGLRPAAAAWSPNEEERRKAVHSYLMSAIAYIIWDNIKRGSQITCPHIERSCTTDVYIDRRLGVSEIVAASAAAIHFFTGNNIGPTGDLASRALNVRLDVDRPDPENRPFRHPDPLGWTEANRCRILTALYTMLMANPAHRASAFEPRTRFKTWYRLCGSAVEHAATLCGQALDLSALFLSQEEEDDEETASLADALAALVFKWPDATPFQASDVARLINDNSAFALNADKECAATLGEFLFPEGAVGTVTAKAVGNRLKGHLDEPVKAGIHTFCLKEVPRSPGYADSAKSYFVRIT